jgi:hypothetical protein
VLIDGQRYLVFNIAWGYDEGDEWAHVTTNISPRIEGEHVDFFFTSLVVAALDPSTDDLLYSLPATAHNSRSARSMRCEITEYSERHERRDRQRETNPKLSIPSPWFVSVANTLQPEFLFRTRPATTCHRRNV